MAQGFQLLLLFALPFPSVILKEGHDFVKSAGGDAAHPV